MDTIRKCNNCGYTTIILEDQRWWTRYCRKCKLKGELEIISESEESKYGKK